MGRVPANTIETKSKNCTFCPRKPDWFRKAFETIAPSDGVSSRTARPGKYLRANDTFGFCSVSIRHDKQTDAECCRVTERGEGETDEIKKNIKDHLVNRSRRHDIYSSCRTPRVSRRLPTRHSTITTRARARAVIVILGIKYRTVDFILYGFFFFHFCVTACLHGSARDG